MRRWLAAMTVLVLALGGNFAFAAPAPTGAKADDLAAEIDAARDMLSTDAPGAEQATRALMARPDFNSAPQNVRDYAERVLGWALLDQHKCEEALALSHRLVAAPQPAEYDWRIEISGAVACSARARAAEALAALVRAYPDALRTMDDDIVRIAAAESSDPQLLSYLVDGSWRPQHATTDISGLRLALVRAHLAHGDRERAAETAQALVTNGGNSLVPIFILLLDKTFDPLVTADPSAYDLDGILQWRMNNARAQVDANPTSLEAVDALARAYFERNQLSEAKAVLDEALRRIAATPEAPPYADLDTELNWTHNLASQIQEAIGDEDAALAALRQGAETLEHGSSNVSQRLNLAGMLVELGQPERALAQVEGFDTSNASAYGVMVLRAVRACAYAQLHDDAHMNPILAEMRAHAEDAPNEMLDAALCANDLDLAATWFIRQLDEPGQRMMAILSVQTFAGDDRIVTEAQRTQHDRFAALIARPDVHAAIERACHVRTFTLRRPY